jgi:hypothetical protein
MKIGPILRFQGTFESIRGLDDALAKLDAESNEEDADAFDLLDEAESVLGLGFTGLQVYISKTMSAGWRSFKPIPDLEKLGNLYCPLKVKGKVSAVEAIWAAGNYYKHHDDWPADWEKATDPRQVKTIRVLKKLGITSTTTHPCVEIMALLRGENWGPRPLAEVLKVASKWAGDWFSAAGVKMLARAKTGPKTRKRRSDSRPNARQAAPART